MEHHDNQQHLISYGTYITVWLSLLILTGLTVAVAGVHLGKYNVFIALLVAAFKSSLVLLYFMHLRYENRLFHAMFLVVLFTITVIVALTYVDTLAR